MKVPLYKQSKKACGPTALRMVMSYWGKDVSEKDIVKGVGGTKSYGVRTIQLASYVKKLGFKFECLSYNTKMAAGQARIKIPSKSYILKYLKKRIPVILAVRKWVLYCHNEI